MFSRNYYYLLRLRRHSTDPSPWNQVRNSHDCELLPWCKTTRRSNGYNYYFSRFLLRFIIDRFQFGWKAVLKSWWQLWQSPTTLLLLLLLLLPLLKLPSSYKSFEYSTTYNLPTRSTYHPTFWAVVLSPVWKSVRTYANCYYYYYDPHSPPMWSNLYLIIMLDLYLPQDRILYDRERKKKYLQNKKKVGWSYKCYYCIRMSAAAESLLTENQLTTLTTSTSTTHTILSEKKLLYYNPNWRLPALGGVPIFKPRLITNCEREEAANGNYYFANWEKKRTRWLMLKFRTM